QVGGRAERVCGGDAAIEQCINAIHELADEGELDLARLQHVLQTLQRREVAARVVADANLHVGQVLGRAERRLRRHVDARRRDRVGMAPHAPVLGGGGHVYRPVAEAKGYFKDEGLDYEFVESYYGQTPGYGSHAGAATPPPVTKGAFESYAAG